MDDDRELDQRLDEALQSYAGELPRTGLELRVLARVKMEAVRPPSFSRWWRMVALTSAAACLAILAVYAFHAERHTTPAAKTASIPRSNAPAPPRGMDNRLRVEYPASREVRAHVLKPLSKVSRKQAVFPRPEPLSQEERLLLAYAAQRPKPQPLVANEPIHLEPIRIAQIAIDPLPPLTVDSQH